MSFVLAVNIRVKPESVDGFMKKLGDSVVLPRLEKFAGGVPTSLAFNRPSRS